VLWVQVDVAEPLVLADEEQVDALIVSYPVTLNGKNQFGLKYRNRILSVYRFGETYNKLTVSC
jgi:hypothetical protein